VALDHGVEGFGGFAEQAGDFGHRQEDESRNLVTLSHHFSYRNFSWPEFALVY
jgi:hypothetical protein